jgi:hypothetical protein
MKKSRVPKSVVSSRTHDSLAVDVDADASVMTASAPADVTVAEEGMGTKKAKKNNGKRGIKEESTARIPRVRVLYSLFLQNQMDGVKKYPTNAEIGRILDPVQPLKVDAVRAVLAMMRDDLALPVDFIREKDGHGFTEPVAGVPLDAVTEEQAYALIQSVQMLGVHRQSKAYAELRSIANFSRRVRNWTRQPAGERITAAVQAKARRRNNGRRSVSRRVSGTAFCVQPPL